MRPTEEAASRRTTDELCDEDELLAAVSREAGQPVRRAFEPGTFGRLPPIYFIGDSRSVAFLNGIYTSEFTARSYLLRSVHLRNLFATDFCSRDGVINDALLHVLAADLAVIGHEGGARWTAAPTDHVAGNGSAPVVLFCDLADAFHIVDALGPDVDIPAWDELSLLCDVSRVPAARLASADDTLDRAIEALEPFARGVEALQAIGFDRIFLHGCPRLDLGERFEGTNSRAKWRRQIHPNVIAKALLLFDAAIRVIAARAKVRYLSGPVDAAACCRLP